MLVWDPFVLPKLSLRPSCTWVDEFPKFQTFCTFAEFAAFLPVSPGRSSYKDAVKHSLIVR